MTDNDIVISAEHLAKCYNLYEKPINRLKEVLNPFGRKYHHNFSALDDVSFNVRRGETLGIVGRNGSGKSTLLKIVSGVVTPSVGHVAVSGRVSSLLELGAGFNSELSGLENAYLQGVLMGFSRTEMKARIPGILAFADIGEFIYQPVKQYSSGMFVRLAFACAISVNPDILIVDEALAVGDAIFVQKCMRFIRGFQKSGSLLFVSHDMNAIINLCSRALWLDSGRVRMLGKSRTVAEAYLQDTLQNVYGKEASLHSVRDGDALNLSVPMEADENPPESTPSNNVPEYGSLYHVQDNLADANGWKSGAAEITSLSVLLATGTTPPVFEGGETVRLTIRAVAHTDLARPMLGFLVRDHLGQDLFGENTVFCNTGVPMPVSAGQAFESEFVFRLPMLLNGSYVLMASLADGDLERNVQHHLLHDAAVINVVSSRVRWGLVGVSFQSIQLRRIG